MTEKIDRRSFMNQTAIMGASLILPARLESLLPTRAEAVDLAVVTGKDYYQSTLEAVGLLGGMNLFVSKNAVVGLIVNSPWKNPGTSTNPSVALAVIKMCYDAGAKEIWSIEGASPSYWRASDRAEALAEEIGSLKADTDNYAKVDIPEGKSLKTADIERKLLDCDVLINVPIVKDHEGTRFTSTLKNMMGSTARATNRFFHLGDNPNNDNFYGDVGLLSQCIADLNLVRKSDLCITDATEMIVENGPAGPGKLIKPQKVIAGTDRVAVDAYSAKVLGLEPDNVLMIKNAHQHGLGEIDLSKLQIQEKTI
jgi:uncharacterized protein (DUF362 family)